MRLHLHRLIALCLVLAWGPAAMCCTLEAAGADSICVDDNCHSDDGTTAPVDGCNLLESGDYRDTDPTITASAPTSFICACLICLKALVVPQADGRLAGLRQQDRPREWTAGWHFQRRAAALAHAPDSQLG